MGRLPPQERWHRHILERYTALKESGELKRLRTKGLAILGRKKAFTGEEWFKSFHKRVSRPEYLEWCNECKAVAERFGLEPGSVVCACLVKGYNPEKELLVMEADWPRIRVITDSTDPRFIARLVFEAHKLGLYVVQRHGSMETIVVPMAAPEPSALPFSMPPLYTTFRMRVETPVGYPPEAARNLEKEAAHLSRELLACLGYVVPKRLRTSSLVSKADELKASEAPLPKRGLYELVSELWPGDEDITTEADEARRKVVKSRRHKVRKRLRNIGDTTPE